MKKAVNMSFPVKLFCGFLFSSAIPAIGISLLIHVQVTRFYKNELGNLYIEKLRVADTVLNMWEEETKKNALIISLNCGRLLGEYIQNREKNALDESKNKYDTVTSLMAASTILEDIVMVNSLYSSISLVYETSEYLINSNHGVRKNNNPETIKKYSAGIVEGKHWFVENDAGEGGHRLIYTFPVVSGFMRHKGIIIFEISEKELSGTINGNTDGSAAKIFIMDDKGTVISDADKSNLGKNLMPVHAVESVYGSPDSKGFFTSKIGGIEYFVIYWTSQLNNWYYCSLVPMTELNHRMNMISLMTAVLIIAFFILTVILSYSLAKRLNIPVQRMEYRLEDYKLIQSLLGKFDNQAVVSRPDIPEQAHPQKYFFHPYFCCVLLRTDRPDYLTKTPEENAAIGGGGGGGCTRFL
jgi:hypothetical protein